MDTSQFILPLFILAFAPGLFWLWYFYHRDRYEPEPVPLVLKIFFLGMLVTIPVAFIEGAFAIFVAEIVLAVFIAPIVEESSKYLVVRKFVYDRIEFNDPMDGIVYATAAALGFASLENIVYVFSSLQTSVTLAIGTGVIRALLSVPGHALFSSMWGYSLGQAKFRPENERRGIIVRGLILAMIFHGLFNFLLADYIGVAILILILVPGMWLLVNKKINLALGRK